MNSPILTSSVTDASRHLSRTIWIQAVALAIAFGIAYARVFSSLVRAWLDNEIYRHGFLVPFIAGYLVWVNRRQLRSLEARPSILAGTSLVLLAGAMLLLGRAGAVAIVQQLSLLVMVPGLVVLLAGWAYLRALALPIAYLFFMIPLLADGTDWVHWPFQLLAANIGIWLLQSLGLAAFREGIYIELPRVTLEIAEACSGIRFMISVIAIGIPLAYLTQRTWPRRLGLVAFGVGIGILANGFRVASIGIWAYVGGEVLKGPFHVFQAMVVAWIGYAALFAGAWLLNRGPLR